MISRTGRSCGNGLSLKMNNIYFVTIIIVALLLVLLSSPVYSSILFQQTFARGAGVLKNHAKKAEEASSPGSSWTWTTTNGSEKWTQTGIRFLTKVKWDNDDLYGDEVNHAFGIAASDFHIIELEPEGLRESDKYKSQRAPETLRIHLMRKSPVLHPQLRVVIRDGDLEQHWNPSEKTALNCHFVGQVTASPSEKGLNSAAGSNNGLALLSACSPSNGFSGLIIMEDGRQWYIEPVAGKPVRKRRRREAYDDNESTYDTLEHVLLPHSELAGHLAAHISDAIRVPLPELEEAARLAAVDAEARRNLISQGWDDSEETLQGESSILTPFLHTGATLPFRSRSGNSKVTSKANLAKKIASTPTRKVPPTTLLSPVDSETLESSGSVTSKENRSVQENVVEMAVFIDEELFNKMKTKFTDDTTAQLKEYATAMVNMMDVMYQHTSLAVDLRFKLVYLEVMKRRPATLKTNGGKAKAYLSSFCDYAGEKNANSAQWDHALLLTGVDLHEEGVKTTAGLAWAGTMCYRYYSCSISEGLNFASAYITTHEIGHSLGMEHDGVGISDSCDSTKYIMSPTTGPGKVTWSTCSSSNLQDFIKYGTSELRGKQTNRMISRPICLEELVARDKKSYDDDSTISTSESDLKLPGEKYDANFQCSLGMGTFFKPHFERNKPPFDNICWILYCGNGTHAISTHPALEGTPCDRKKHCRAGQCVKRPET